MILFKCFDSVNIKNNFFKYCRSILNKMVEWFRVVLQWDPRKRGKHPHSDDVVVFPMLREIFPWKVHI